MKLSLVGGVREATLRAALAKASPGEHTLHERNKLAWVALPEGTTPSTVQAAIGERMMIIDVALSGDTAKASRHALPVDKGDKPIDLAATAKDVLASWGPPDPEAPFDDAAHALQLALALAEDIEPPPPPAAIPTGGKGMPLKRKGTGTPREKPMHAVWAEALLDHLTQSEGVELAGDAPIGRLAGLLSKHDIDGALADNFGTTLLDFLVDDTAIEEVFADEDALLTVARNTRPRQ